VRSGGLFSPDAKASEFKSIFSTKRSTFWTCFDESSRFVVNKSIFKGKQILRTKSANIEHHLNHP